MLLKHLFKFAPKRRLKFNSFPTFTTKRSVMDPASKTRMIEAAKKNAAIKAVDDWVKNDQVIGIGSGSTIVYAVERLAEKIATKQLSNIICVPTSFQARQLILRNNLNLGNLESTPKLALTIDGADEVDENMTLIKGGGACLLQEKIVAHASNMLIVIADYTKNSTKLGEKYKRGIPIEVVPMAYKPLQIAIQDQFGGEAKLRMGLAKAGPVITDNGNFILDWIFPYHSAFNWDQVSVALKVMPGVIDTGLFVNMATIAYFGKEGEEVLIRRT